MQLGLGSIVAQLRPKLGKVYCRGATQLDELLRLVREAGRDARHRLRTGRPRGMPKSFVHPPLEGSKGCSLAARRVRGLLYGYSLAYQEVRPRVETMAAALGYSKSTTYNATAELRQVGLLVVHERRGLDHRRVANRYEVRDTPGRALLITGGPPSGSQRGPSEIQKTRMGSLNADRENEETRLDNSACDGRGRKDAPGLAKVRRRRSVPIGEDKLAEVIGLGRFRALKARFAGALVDLRQVISEHEAAQHPAVLAASCDALIAQRASIKNPGGYLRGVLQRQLGERDGIHAELLEVMEEHRQACVFRDPRSDALASQAAALEERLSEPARPVLAIKGRATVSKAMAVTPSACPARERARRLGTLDQTVEQLRLTHPRLAEIIANPPGFAERLRAQCA